MKTHFIVLISSTVLLTHTGYTQLYSSGNNTIGGNRVGIGVSNPNAMIDIKNTVIPPANCNNCLSFAAQDDPALRIQTDIIPNPSGSGTTTTYEWEITAEESFEIKNGLSNNFALSIGEDESEISSPSTFFAKDIHLSTYQVNYGRSISLGLGISHIDGDYTVSNNAVKGAMLENENGNLHIYSGMTNSNSPTPRMTVKSNGRVGIGTKSPEEALELKSGDLLITDGRLLVADQNGDRNFYVNPQGDVVAREILVDMEHAIPDYVFDENYNLMSLEELKEFIDEHHHLPNVPSAKDYAEAGGVELGELTRLLLEKQEELTLYIFQLEEKLAKLSTNESN
ncbi:MAG: hypothetical protein Salg2KO_14310 [Salibacteraceae bacterium]